MRGFREKVVVVRGVQRPAGLVSQAHRDMCYAFAQ